MLKHMEIMHILYNPPNLFSEKKICFFVSDTVKQEFEATLDEQSGWNVLDEIVFVHQSVLTTWHSSFYFRILKQGVDRLTDAGIMKYLIDTYIYERRELLQPASEPQVLYVEDLMFGFNIWIGFCIVCGVVFFIEILLGIRWLRKRILSIFKKYKKVKYAKTKPLSNKKAFSFPKGKPETLDLFKIKKHILDDDKIKDHIDNSNAIDSEISENITVQDE